MANLNNFAGFDISKLYFDLCILGEDRTVKTARFTNDEKGFSEFFKILPSQVHCVMEATGSYYLPLACRLHKNSIKVSVVNPLVIRRYAQMQLRRVKTDKADAGLIEAS